jgi:putative tricarboxylic transport membrane protein
VKLNDAILGLVVLLGGLAIVLQARTFQPTHGQAYGPDLFPTIIGIGLMMAGLGLVVSGWRARLVTGWLDTAGIGTDRLIDAGLVLLVILAFIFLTDWLGFLLTAGVGTFLLMVRFRSGAWLSSAIVTVVIVLAVDWAFRTMLLVPLPLGSVLPRLPW